MKKVKKVISLLNYNLKTLVGFEALYKILTLLIFMPLFLNLFNLITKITGYSYLTLENFLSFLLNPIVIVLLIILFLLMAVYTLFDIAAIIVILDASYQKKKIKISDACSIALKKCQGFFKIKNIMVVFLVLFLIPFLNIGVSSSLIATIKIPEFIMEYIIKNRFLLSLIVSLYVLLLILLLRLLYIFHYHVVEGKNFLEARKDSIKLSKKSHLKDLATLIVVQLVIFILYFLLLIAGILLIMLVSKVFEKILIIKSLSATIIWLFIAFTFIVFVLLTTPISYATISVLYYLHKDEKKEKIKHIIIDENKNTKTNKWLKRITWMFSLWL